MSLTMNKVDGVTVFTLTADPGSRWPPVCQMLSSLCYSPVCCSVSEALRRIQRASLSVLGALQIIVGLLNIGLGAIIQQTYTMTYYVGRNGSPFWLGGMFILFGIVCILSEKYPSPCLVILNVVLSLAGVAFAITAIVLYSIGMSDVYLWWSDCYQSYYWSRATQIPGEEYFQNKCLQSQNLILMLVRSLWVVLIVLSVLELCVVISSVVLGIKALKSSDKEQNKSGCDSEQIKPLLEEV